jgi:hypothetical protein
MKRTVKASVNFSLENNTFLSDNIRFNQWNMHTNVKTLTFCMFSRNLITKWQTKTMTSLFAFIEINVCVFALSINQTHVAFHFGLLRKWLLTLYLWRERSCLLAHLRREILNLTTTEVFFIDSDIYLEQKKCSFLRK